MQTVGSQMLLAIVSEGRNNNQRAQLVIEILEPHLEGEALPSKRTVSNWLAGKSIPNGKIRRIFHDIGIGWGTWLVPANVAEILIMQPPPL